MRNLIKTKEWVENLHLYLFLSFEIIWFNLLIIAFVGLKNISVSVLNSDINVSTTHIISLWVVSIFLVFAIFFFTFFAFVILLNLRLEGTDSKQIQQSQDF